jgi:hypothetical protein
LNSIFHPPPVLDTAPSADRFAVFGNTASGDYVYVLAFKMVNPASAQAAPTISIHVDDSFEKNVSPQTHNPATQSMCISS